MATCENLRAASIGDATVDAVVTSPPYSIREQSYAEPVIQNRDNWMRLTTAGATPS